MEKQEQIRLWLIGFTLIHFALVAFVCAFPLWYLIYYYPIYTGAAVYNAYTFAWLNISWWVVFFFILFNLLLPFLLLFAITEYNSAVRVDIHTVATTFSLIINIVAVILFTISYFFFINTSYSGSVPFNDYLWCCEFANINPTQCPNTLQCPHPALRPNYNFVLMWIFSGVFLGLTIIHLGCNHLLRVTGSVAPPNSNPFEGLIFGIGFNMFYLALFAYWVAVPLWYTIYINGYPLIGSPPGPNAFVSVQYGWQWVFVLFLILNFIPPVLFFWALNMSDNVLVINAYFWITVVVGFFTLASLVLFIGVLVFDCNLTNWSGGSICNSYLWCCAYFDSAPDICPNTTPCDPEPALFVNSEFIQHIVFALIFIVLNALSLWLYYRMKRYGIFESE